MPAASTSCLRPKTVTERWLLAAEADQIQDLVFRASRLREVAGGSQLLERFCEEAPDAVRERIAGERFNPDDLVIQRGGAFRALFDDKEEARRFGRELAYAYRQLTGGTMTIADPEPYQESKDGAWPEASKAAHTKLVAAKRRGAATEGLAQSPYSALCASCGIGLATAYEARPKVQDARPDYVCADCRSKFGELEGAELRKAFFDEVQTCIGDKACRPQQSVKDADWANAIGQLDPRRYVAYLGADGNGMGKVFAACPSPASTKKLSDALRDTLNAALAESAACAATRLWDDPELSPAQQADLPMPVLPLIIGGDDLFALLPARLSVAIAQRFIRRYEAGMQDATRSLTPGSSPTISAAVVICKANYPHTLARRRCELELGRAKRLAHLQSPETRSVLAMAVITGNQTGGGQALGGSHVEATLSPYVLGPAAATEPDRLDRLFQHHQALERLPQKRRAELARLYADIPADARAPGARSPLDEDWAPRLEALLARVGRDSALRRKVCDALRDLGDIRNADLGYWLETGRPWLEDRRTFGHGIGDLMRLWPWLEDLDETRYSSEEQE